MLNIRIKQKSKRPIVVDIGSSDSKLTNESMIDVDTNTTLSTVVTEAILYVQQAF